MGRLKTSVSTVAEGKSTCHLFLNSKQFTHGMMRRSKVNWRERTLDNGMWCQIECNLATISAHEKMWALVQSNRSETNKDLRDMEEKL